jgi:superfamily II DNA helicase RecQ
VAPETFLRGFDRPNIHLAFAAKDNPRDQILRFAAARKGQSGIVYCGTRAKTETLAAALCARPAIPRWPITAAWTPTSAAWWKPASSATMA